MFEKGRLNSRMAAWTRVCVNFYFNFHFSSFILYLLMFIPPCLCFIDV